MTAAALLFAAWLAAQQPAPAPEEEPICAGLVPRVAPGTEAPSPWAHAPRTSAQWFDPRNPGDGPVIVNGGDFQGRSFKGAKLSRVCFENVNLANTDWTGAEMADGAFVRSDLTGAKLAGRFRRTVFVSADLAGAKADGADLTDAEFEGGSFGGLSLRNATLRRFKLDCSGNLFVHGEQCTDSAPNSEDASPPAPVDARGADLTEAEFVEWDGAWTLDGAVIDRTRVEIEAAGWLRGAVFRGPIVVTGGSASLALTEAEWKALQGAWKARSRHPQASFDCARASTVVERRICDPKHYGHFQGLDRDLHVTYRAALAQGATTVAEQRAWLRERDGCAVRKPEEESDACLEKAYVQRSEALRRRTRPAWLKAGAEAVYVSEDLPVTPAFRATPLYGRLAPVIAGASDSVVHLKLLPDGRLEATGTALAYNGHTCTLAGEPFTLNPATGWWRGRRDPAGLEPGEAPEQDVLRLYGDRVEVVRDTEFSGCGVRAGWGEMTRLQAPAAAVAAIRAQFAEEYAP